MPLKLKYGFWFSTVNTFRPRNCPVVVCTTTKSVSIGTGTSFPLFWLTSCTVSTSTAMAIPSTATRRTVRATRNFVLIVASCNKVQSRLIVSWYNQSGFIYGYFKLRFDIRDSTQSSFCYHDWFRFSSHNAPILNSNRISESCANDVLLQIHIQFSIKLLVIALLTWYFVQWFLAICNWFCFKDTII